MVRVASSLLSLFVALIIPSAESIAADEPQPVKALVLLGGEHHRYEEGSKILAEALAKKMAIAFDFVRIDNPPEGRPNAEKATIPSNPALLEDFDLNKKYDLIIAYHQDAYVKLTHKQRDGLLHFVRSGGPWVGMHSAGDTLKTDIDFIRMVGGTFETHPPFGPMQVQRVAGDHFITDGMADFATKDEFYHMKMCSLDDKNILLVARSPGDGKTRPVAWTKKYGRGKVFYTVLGHAPVSFRNEHFQTLMHRAVLWALKPETGDAGPDGWIELFNGRDLDGWTHCGPGGFAIEDGGLKSIDGMGLLWYHAKKFRDFTLSIEWKVSREQDNSGIFVRFPDPPADEWEPVSTGYEIQICDTAGPKHSTGAVYSFQGPSKIVSHPAGEWNLMEITVIGQTYTIKVNGETVVDGYEGNRGRDGYIGLQNHDPKAFVFYRNIRVKEL